VTITSAVTDAGCGIYQMNFIQGDGSWIGLMPYAASYPGLTIDTSVQGVITVHARFRDQLGNMTPVTDTIVYDSLLPATSAITSITAGIGGQIYVYKTIIYLRGTVIINANAVDDTGGSGIATVEFYDGLVLLGTDTSSPYSYSWTTSGSGVHANIHMIAYDNAGNTLASAAVSRTTDNISPSGDFVIGSNDPDATTTRDMTLYISYTDTGSGIYQMRFKNESLKWSTWVAYARTYTWTLSLNYGVKTVYAEFIDHVGNVTSHTDTISYQRLIILPPK
jgi:hypothetical protein